MIEQNCIFDKSYRLKYLIGQGSYGKVYAANDIFLRNKCVIKIEKCDCPRPVLNKEAQFIKLINRKGVDGMPTLVSQG